MTKNTKTILLSLLACLLVITGFELGAGRLKFGNATLNDSTSALITTNKGFLVNGKLSTSNYADLSNGVRFGDTNIYIDDDGLDMRFSTATNGSYIFGTKSLTTLASIDSTNGLSHKVATSNGSWNGANIAYKFLRTVAPTGNSTVTVAHGLTDGRIIDARIWLRHDTTLTTAYYTSRNWYVAPNITFEPTITYYAGYDSLYAWARFPAGATATRGDSLYFLLTYWQ